MSDKRTDRPPKCQWPGEVHAVFRAIETASRVRRRARRSPRGPATPRKALRSPPGVAVGGDRRRDGEARRRPPTGRALGRAPPSVSAGLLDKLQSNSVSSPAVRIRGCSVPRGEA